MNKQVSRLLVVLVAVAAAVLCSGCGTVSQGPEEGEVRRITVSGNSELRVVPDEVILTIGVETVDVIMNVAKGENDAIIERVLGLVGDFGVESKHVQTDFISIEPHYDSYYERKDFIGYFVRKNVAITLQDLSQFEELLSALLDAGVTHIHGIDFRSTELRQAKDRARALAVQAAEEKAAAMAAELGQNVGRPVLIREERSDWGSWYSAWWGSSWGGAMAQNVIQNAGSNEPFTDGALAPGQIAISAQVSVTFELTD